MGTRIHTHWKPSGCFASRFVACARGHVGARARLVAPIQCHCCREAQELGMPSLSRTAPRHDAAMILRLLLPRAPPLPCLPRPPGGPHILTARTHVQELMDVRIAPRTHDRPAAGALVSGLACPVDGLHSHSRALSALRGRASARQGHLARARTHTNTLPSHRPYTALLLAGSSARSFYCCRDSPLPVVGRAPQSHPPPYPPGREFQ